MSQRETRKNKRPWLLWIVMGRAIGSKFSSIRAPYRKANYSGRWLSASLIQLNSYFTMIGLLTFLDKIAFSHWKCQNRLSSQPFFRLQIRFSSEDPYEECVWYADMTFPKRCPFIFVAIIQSIRNLPDKFVLHIPLFRWNQIVICSVPHHEWYVQVFVLVSTPLLHQICYIPNIPLCKILGRRQDSHDEHFGSRLCPA